MKRGGLPVLSQRLLVDCDGSFQVLLLDQRVAFARERFADKLVVCSQGPRLLHCGVTVLYALVQVPGFKIDSRPARPRTINCYVLLSVACGEVSQAVNCYLLLCVTCFNMSRASRCNLLSTVTCC